MSNTASGNTNRAFHLGKIVHNESMDWGDSAGKTYHDVADQHIDGQWNWFCWPLLSRHGANLKISIDFACGRGRNTRKLLDNGAEHVFAVDVNHDNIEQINRRFPKGEVTPVLNNGYDLATLDDQCCSLLYTWDAMVHFDLQLIASYLPEFFRVLIPGSVALIHHSNYSGSPGGDFRTNPHARNFMSSEIFRHLAIRAGFECVEQTIFGWGANPGLDCLSVLRKRAN